MSPVQADSDESGGRTFPTLGGVERGADGS